MRHITSVSDLSDNDIDALLNDVRHPRSVVNAGPVALVFHEPSTRTRFSFASAALMAGCHPVDLNVGESSERKGETALDTCRNLQWAGAKAIVLRTSKSGLPLELSAQLGIPVINAGDGTNEHPTQALGDMLTLWEHFNHNLSKSRTITIIGDIGHSRVARSNAFLLSRLGWNVRLVGPHIPTDLPGVHFGHRRKFVDAVAGSDVVMVLRWQNERQSYWPSDPNEAHSMKVSYQVSENLLQVHAPNAMVMHPGPINRGVEISEEVADGPRSLVRKQVECGLRMRAAILRFAIDG